MFQKPQGRGEFGKLQCLLSGSGARGALGKGVMETEEAPFQGWSGGRHGEGGGGRGPALS